MRGADGAGRSNSKMISETLTYTKYFKMLHFRSPVLSIINFTVPSNIKYLLCSINVFQMATSVLETVFVGDNNVGNRTLKKSTAL